MLEPGEICFEDFSVTFYNDSSDITCRGRLRLCSKSVLFEPKEVKNAILKINFSSVNSVQHEYSYTSECHITSLT